MKRLKNMSMMFLFCLLVSMIAMPISASASAKLNKKSITLNVGKTYALKARGIKGTVTWSSSKKSVATVTPMGVVTAVKRGTAIITAKYGKKKLTCKVTVKQPVTSVKLNKTSATLQKGKSLTLKATVFPSNANNKTVTWKSSNKKIATVSSKGVVKAVGSGTATITASANGVTAKCNVTVKKVVSYVTVRNAYWKYANDNLLYSSKYPYANYTLLDINCDSIPEMPFSYACGMRSGYHIYTYINGKVTCLKKLTGVTNVYYCSSKKQICIMASGGAADGSFTYYQLVGGVLRQVLEYESVSHYYIDDDTIDVKYYKNGKRISEDEYLDAFQRIDIDGELIINY